jgi:HNH endonuclease
MIIEAAALCDVADCDGEVFSRQWCQMHYTRWLRHGNPLHIARDLRPAYERVMARAVRNGDCLEFTGSRNRGGYGMIRDRGRMRLAARVVIEHHLGTSDLHVLHSCDNEACVEIEHLRYGTHQENIAERQERNNAYPISNQWGSDWPRRQR